MSHTIMCYNQYYSQNLDHGPILDIVRQSTKYGIMQVCNLIVRIYN